MKTKLETARLLYVGGDSIGALKIISKFKRLDESKDIIMIAIGCINNPNFYSQLGHNISECVNNGVQEMIKKYKWSV